jgi:hypothetical protein
VKFKVGRELSSLDLLSVGRVRRAPYRGNQTRHLLLILLCSLLV